MVQLAYLLSTVLLYFCCMRLAPLKLKQAMCMTDYSLPMLTPGDWQGAR